MQQHWFYDVWAFIGAGGAIVMVAIMMTTDTFRSNLTVSRWRDAVWLAWLAAPLYWVHQLEEYSLPVIGLLWNPRLLPFIYLVRYLLMMVGAVEVLTLAWNAIHDRRASAPPRARPA